MRRMYHVGGAPTYTARRTLCGRAATRCADTGRALARLVRRAQVSQDAASCAASGSPLHTRMSEKCRQVQSLTAARLRTVFRT
jgi:hypothetical protein